MNDEHFTYSDEHDDPGPGRGDGEDVLEDRMLALAMGLDDDPDLRAQLAVSPELRARYQGLRDELAAVEEGVLRAVPEEPVEWADLSNERWANLRPYVSTAQGDPRTQAAARGKTRRWRRWQALAPAAVAVVIGAVVLGVVLNNNGLQSLDRSSGGSTATDKAAEGGGYGTAAQPSVSNGALAIEGAAAYDTVVVARAGAAADASQTFAVERTLKGSAPAAVKLETEVGGRVVRGSLAVLFLDPRDDASPCPTPLLQADDGSMPAPSPSASTTAGGGRESASLYLYEGRCAAVVTLPKGVTAEDVQIQ
jgi:hypothetical protein